MFRFLAMMLFVFLASTVQAQSDPFLSDSSQGGSFANEMQHRYQKKEAETFSGPIKRLLNMAGEDTKPDRWSDFEKVEDPYIQERYNSLLRWRMEEEDKKPLPRKKAFSTDLDELQKDLAILGPTKKRR